MQVILNAGDWLPHAGDFTCRCDTKNIVQWNQAWKTEGGHKQVGEWLWCICRSAVLHERLVHTIVSSELQGLACPLALSYFVDAALVPQKGGVGGACYWLTLGSSLLCHWFRAGVSQRSPQLTALVPWSQPAERCPQTRLAGQVL